MWPTLGMLNLQQCRFWGAQSDVPQTYAVQSDIYKFNKVQFWKGIEVRGKSRHV